MKSKFYAFLILNFSVAVTLFSQQGQLDPSFGVNGVVKQSFNQTFGYYDEAQSLAILNDGKILVAGKHDYSMVFARFEEDGDLDLSFGDSGAVFIDYAWLASDYVSGLIVQPDGKILALVQSSRYDSDTGDDGSNTYVMRFSPDLEFDSTFGHATLYAPMGVAKVETGFEVTTVNSFQLLPNGKILVAGSVRNSFVNGLHTYVAKLNANGTPDISFGTGGVALPSWNEPMNSSISIGHLTLQSDGKLLLSGSYSILFGTSAYVIARLNTDGSIDNSFGINGRVTGTLPSANYYVQKLFLMEDGNLIAWINGDLIPPLSLDVIRLKPNGAFDTSFGINGITHIPNEKLNRIARIMRDDEGSFFLAGERNDSTYYNHPDFALAKLSQDFNWVEDFGNSGLVFNHDSSTYDRVKSAAILPDGNVLLVGSASPIYYAADMVLAKYFGRDTTVTTDTVPPPDSLILNEEGLTILPNPVGENFSLCYPLSELSIITIELYDSSGRLLHVFLEKAVRNAGMNCEEFNWPSDVEKGVYFVTLSGRKFAYSGKIIKS